jgi:hypothetical protein
VAENNHQTNFIIMSHLTLDDTQQEFVKKVSENYANNQLCLDNKASDELLNMSDDSIIRFAVAKYVVDVCCY